MQLQEQVHAKALFFRPVDYAALAANYAGANLVPVMELEDNEKELIATHKTLFARQCVQNHIHYTLHDHDRQSEVRSVVATNASGHRWVAV